MIVLAALVPSLILAAIFWLIYKLYQALTGPDFSSAELRVSKTQLLVGEVPRIEFEWVVSDNDDGDRIPFKHWFYLEDIGDTPPVTGASTATTFQRTLVSVRPSWQTPGEKTIRGIAEIIVDGRKRDLELEGMIEVVAVESGEDGGGGSND